MHIVLAGLMLLTVIVAGGLVAAILMGLPVESLAVLERALMVLAVVVGLIVAFLTM